MREIKQVPIPSGLQAALAAKRDRLGSDLVVEMTGISLAQLNECCSPMSRRNTMFISTLDKLVTRLELDINFIYEAEAEAKRLIEEKGALPPCRNA